jgi:hypothetical protein
MEVTYPYTELAPMYQTARRHIPGDCNVIIHLSEDLKYHVIYALIRRYMKTFYVHNFHTTVHFNVLLLWFTDHQVT